MQLWYAGGSYSFACLLYYVLIRFLYFYLVYGACVLWSLTIVFYYKVDLPLKDKLSNVLVLSIVLYPPLFLCFFIVKNILLPHPAGFYVVLTGTLFLILYLVLKFSGEYGFQSLNHQCVSFKKKPFGRWGVLSPLLWSDCYRIMAIVEIEELPRERIRFRQRPLQTEYYFRRMGVEEYQSEVGAYLKKCNEGAAEIQLIHDRDIIMNVRRYTIAEGRRYVSTKKSVKEALSYLNGALKALPFDLKKVTDGKINFKGRHYVLEVLTKIKEKIKKKELDQDLYIYGMYAKNSYIKAIIVITETRESKVLLLRYIKQQFKHLRNYFEVFNFSESDMKLLEDLLLYDDPYFGQKNKMN